MKDIEQFRNIVTNQGSLAYLDLPFVIIYLIALVAIVGKASIVAFIGIAIFIIFGFYSRLIFQSQMIKSSRAGELKKKSWFEVLSNAKAIQALPLFHILSVRFGVANNQAANDTAKLAKIQNVIADSGAFLTQMIGVLSIVVVVNGVLDGDINSGAMLAMVILIWKALSPLQAIYNTIIKMRQMSLSGAQINNLMAVADERDNMHSTIPLIAVNGKISLENVNFRYPGTLNGFTQVTATFEKGEVITLVGPSGSGKSTLLKVVAGLYDTYQGVIHVDDYNLKQFNPYIYRNCLSYSPQDRALFLGSIRENFYLANSDVSDNDMLASLKYFKLADWFSDGLGTIIDNANLLKIPSGILTRLHLAIALCSLKG